MYIFIYHGIGIGKGRESLIDGKATGYCVATCRIFGYQEGATGVDIWYNLCDIYICYGHILMGLL